LLYCKAACPKSWVTLFPPLIAFFYARKIGEVKKLPRKKQEQLIRMIDAFLAAERA